MNSRETSGFSSSLIKRDKVTIIKTGGHLSNLPSACARGPARVPAGPHKHRKTSRRVSVHLTCAGPVPRDRVPGKFLEVSPRCLCGSRSQAALWTRLCPVRTHTDGLRVPDLHGAFPVSYRTGNNSVFCRLSSVTLRLRLP